MKTLITAPALLALAAAPSYAGCASFPSPGLF